MLEDDAVRCLLYCLYAESSSRLYAESSSRLCVLYDGVDIEVDVRFADVVGV